MKKFSLLGICLFGAFALSAQTEVVKEVEQALKGANPDYAAALAKSSPPSLTKPRKTTLSPGNSRVRPTKVSTTLSSSR